MIAPFHPISCTHTLSLSLLHPHPILTPVSYPPRSKRSIFFPSFFLPLPLSLSLHPLVNKAEARDYPTFIRFRGESASLTGKEEGSSGAEKRALRNVTPSFRPLHYIFRPPSQKMSPLDISPASQPCFLPVIEHGETIGCCRLNWRPFE